jgi:hypothetical protein
MVEGMGFWKKTSDADGLRLVAEDEQGIASVKLAQCRHCGRVIYRPSLHTWAHLENNLVICDPLVHEHRRAEPGLQA